MTRLGAFAIGFAATMAAFILIWSSYGEVGMSQPAQASELHASQR